MAGDIRSSSQIAGFGDGQQGGDAARHVVPDAPLALYRRYRPATFAEVKGQDHVTGPLRQALRSGRVHHAYLFSGPRGCGKTSSARILARSLNCEAGPTPDPCGVCASCVALGPSGSGSIDVIEIDAASHGGIDDARDLRERAFYSPVAARYKIYIIDEAHMVTGAGFNALLKLVEEPPPHLKFVFATTEPEKVIPTIRSRTHHYPFRLVPPAVLRELLEEILGAEKIAYEPAILPVVIRAGAGSARDTLSVVDQLIAGSDEHGLRYERAIALLGYTDDALLDETTDAFAAGDGAAVFVAIDHVVEAGHDPRRFAMDLLDRLRDLIVLTAVPGAAVSGLLDVPADRLERMRGQATAFGQERLVGAAEIISNGLVEMRGATSPRLLLELMCAQVLLPPATASPGAPGPGDASDVLARLERLERQVASVAGRADRPAASPAVPRAAEGGQVAAGRRPQRPAARQAEAPQAEAAPADLPGSDQPRPDPRQAQAVSLDLAALRDRWPDVLDSVREVRKTAWILLSSYATIESVDGNVLTLSFDGEGNAKGFASSGSDGDLAEVLNSLFGVRLAVRTRVRSGAARPSSPAARQPANDGGGPAGPARAVDGTGLPDLAGSNEHRDEQGAVGLPPEPDRPKEATERSDRVKPAEASQVARPDDASHANGRDSEASAGRVTGGPRGASKRTQQDAKQDGSGPAASRQRAPRKSAQGASPRAAAHAADPRDDPPDSDLNHAGASRQAAGAGGEDATDELTGSELIMRELGGRVIEEVGEA